MTDSQVNVTYKAVANFLDLKRKVAAARKELEALKKTEASYNKSSIDGSKKFAAAQRDATKSIRQRTNATKTATNAILSYNAALKENNSLVRANKTASSQAAEAVRDHSSAAQDAVRSISRQTHETEKHGAVAATSARAESALSDTIKRAARARREGSNSFGDFLRGMKNVNREQRAFIPLSGRVTNGAANVLNMFRRLGNWRPRLTPPFVALLPLIAGLLAMLNPLVALLSSVGAAAFGAGSSLLSLGGVILGLVPMIMAAVSAIASLVAAFNGIGGAFSKWKAFREATQKGGGGGGGGRSAADRAWDLLKAQERLSDAQERAADAQDDLNEARRVAVRRLEDLRRAVAGAAMDEAEAAADLQQAIENYYNIMADPGSTLGDKMDASARLERARQAIIDQQQEAIRNAEDLADAEKKGVEGSDEVVRALRAQRDAARELRDAQHNLEKVMRGSGGGGGGAAGAADEFRKALEKLSPSAQKFVLAIIALEERWNQMLRAVQESFFSEIVDDLDLLGEMIPVIENMLVKAAGAMGRLASKFLNLVSSPAWKSDMEIISDQNVRLIELAGDALLSMLTWMKDLTIAAGPFSEKVLGSFASVNANLSDIVASARETGSLAAWLDKVYERLQQWWRIIKNVAATLWNYGAAASDFGQWITDGLEQTTERWKAASEEAREEDSPFKKWLEDIKPVLIELKKTFAGFGNWWKTVSSDPKVLEEVTNILKIVNERLGPALAKLFDTLNDSGIGTSFVDSLSSLVESIQEIIDAGGDAGLKTFFDMITGFFSWLAEIFNDPTWGPVITELSKFAGAMAALSFIGKFTGLFALFGWLMRLAGTAGVLKVLSGLGGLGGLGSALGLGGTAAGGATAGGATAAASRAATATGVTAGAAVAVVGTIGVVNGVGYLIEETPNLLDYVNKAGQAVKKGDITKEEGYSATKQASVGFMGGATQAMFSPVETILNALGLNGTGVSEWIQGINEGSAGFFSDLGANIATWVDEHIIGPWQRFVDPLKSWWDENIGGPFEDLMGTVQEIWNTRIVPAWERFTAALQTVWNAVTAPVRVVWTEIERGWNALMTSARMVWASIERWWNNDVIAPAKGIWNNIRQSFYDHIIVPAFNIWSNIKGKFFETIIDPAKGIWNNIKSFNPITAFNQWLRSQFGLDPKNKSGPLPKNGAIGGFVAKTAQYLAAGGAVRKLGDPRYNMDPKGTDTEPAMLTPGEFVVRKERVDDVGPANMQAFNDGTLSFFELLRKTREARGVSGVGYFSGGGLAGVPQTNFSAVRAQSSASVARTTVVDESTNIGEVHIHYPKRETASDTLPRAIRAVSSGRGRRPRVPRLEKTE